MSEGNHRLADRVRGQAVDESRGGRTKHVGVVTVLPRVFAGGLTGREAMGGEVRARSERRGYFSAKRAWKKRSLDGSYVNFSPWICSRRAYTRMIPSATAFMWS